MSNNNFESQNKLKKDIEILQKGLNNTTQEIVNSFTLEKELNSYFPEEFYIEGLGGKDQKRFDQQILSSLTVITSNVSILNKSIDKLSQPQIESIFLTDFNFLLDNIKDIEKHTKELNKYLYDLLKKYSDRNLKNELPSLNVPQKNILFNEFLDISYRKENILLDLKTLVEFITKKNDLVWQWNKEIDDIKNSLIKDFSKKLEDEKEVILKTYEHDTNILLNEVKNEFKKISLDIHGLTKSSNLLNKNVDSGLNNLTLLNDRIQNLELEILSKINEKMVIVDEAFTLKGKEIEDQINALRSRVITKSKRIQNAHNDFVRLVERAGIYELTQNYKDKAKEEKKDYNFFSWATMIAIGLAIITTIVIITIPIIEHWQANPPVETNYYTILARLSISLMFFVLAVYTSKQSAKHYECYQENHRTFLQLAALEPFMARMSEEEQKTIRKGLIPIYFNQNAEGKFATKGEELGMQFNMQAFVEKFFEVGKNLTDKTNTDQSKPNG